MPRARRQALQWAAGQPAAPAAATPAPRPYAGALRMLRELDASGAWPATSEQRRARISAATPAGGSFTIGAMPPGLPQPAATAQMPALLAALLALERALCPGRPPSTTVAVNRRAQFAPHTDSGAGAGQCRSMIVGLGDYEGGEVVVEGEAHDFRYAPLEFDGWRRRHWTLPFAGERYSLVFFTPHGCDVGAPG